MVLWALRVIGSQHIPGRSWLHRLAAAPKLALLIVLGLVLMWTDRLFVLQSILLALIFMVASAGIGFKVLWPQVRPMILFLLVLAAYTCWMQSPVEAYALILRLSALMLAGVIVTLTTSLMQMMRVLESLLMPLEKIGWLRADRVALAFGLTLRLIPELSIQWHEIREAQAARGINASILTLCVPMLMRTLRRAEEIAEAIDARASDR